MVLGEGSDAPFFNHINVSIGAIARSVDDAIIVTKIQFSPNINHYDPMVPPCPFREQVYEEARKGRVRVGFCESLPTIPATKAVRRAVNLAKEALLRKGYEVA